MGVEVDGVQVMAVVTVGVNGFGDVGVGVPAGVAPVCSLNVRVAIGESSPFGSVSGFAESEEIGQANLTESSRSRR